MSEQTWAGIVYGRSYYLDFRLIAKPKDFTSQEIDWALKYIIPTTRAPNKLSGHPRWSIFKSEYHCIMGVTCMVRDLIGQSSENSQDNLTKDAQGRPLYIFVGYGTQLNPNKRLLDYPPYGSNLGIFQPLYKYVQQCWQVKHYDTHRKQTMLTEYQEESWTKHQFTINFDTDIARRLNCKTRNPSQIFLWQDSEQFRRKLWETVAIFRQPISLCLGYPSKRDLVKSPFLNATAEDINEFTIQEKTELPKPNNYSTKQLTQNHSQQKRVSSETIPKLIENKVKEDIQLTIQHAEQAVEKGQKIVQNLIENTSNQLENKTISAEITENEDFGFKNKSSSANSPKWF
jgi:hypothetical protein